MLRSQSLYVIIISDTVYDVYMGGSLMTTLRGTSTRERAYALLKEDIISGNRAPGERLIEDSLAEEYMVSRTPLREAIHKLEIEGFLTRLPVRGLVVANYSIDEIKDLYQVRSLLEGLATKLTTERMKNDPCLCNELVALRENISYCQSTNTHDRGLVYCNSLHVFVRENCRQEICRHYLENMCEHIRRYKAIGLKDSGRLVHAYEEHMEIMSLMLSGESAKAGEKMSEHVDNSSRSVIAYVERYMAKNK